MTHRRIAAILLTVAAGSVCMAARAAYLQSVGRQRTIHLAERQQFQAQALPARRGSIFDSAGNLLAMTRQHPGIFIDPEFVAEEEATERKRTAEEMAEAKLKLAEALGMTPQELAAKIAQSANRRFVKLTERASAETADKVKKLDIPGVGFFTTSQRCYSAGSTAAHVLGTVGSDSNGLEGVELHYNRILAGRDGYKRSLKDARRRPVSVSQEDYLPPLHGSHLVLTIDANIQMMAEEELGQACNKFKAKRGEAILMDPNTGAILAMACFPTFNPENLADSAMADRRNRAITDPYEPGSTIKPFVATPALFMRVCEPDSMWPIPGASYTTPYGRVIRDVHGYGHLTTWDVLVKSSNIGMCLMGAKMGNDKLFAALSGFAFGKRTGIDLGGEDDGLVYPRARWSKSSTESVAQGYEIMVTPLQLCRAFATIANGGKLLRPYVVKGTIDPEGNVDDLERKGSTSEPCPVADARSTAAMRRILADVPVRGTATHARSKYYNIFGKTGTSHISEGTRGYSSTRYNSSFMGGAPYEKPRLVVTVILHDTDRSLGHFGGTVSAPAAARMLERSLLYLSVPPSPDLDVPPPALSAKLFGFSADAYKRTTREIAD